MGERTRRGMFAHFDRRLLRSLLDRNAVEIFQLDVLVAVLLLDAAIPFNPARSPSRNGRSSEDSRGPKDGMGYIESNLQTST